ncbi:MULTISPECIES: Fur-regulated basic protein FbpA [Fictibacillus]|uniref:Fur-regulated basic protein FbpA n=1 Tax=Fictibacillus terranigra TaxID=3058424 RepID=A0ABT8E7D9_9BACL|nr:Fur-regulated basic protein FbpA [Fictibacillus sp. CENA-BCM004]MDN4073821.1 Fur-regulated basic protein FbpA [Fictibacillus sp. CENA-BCM004]
MGGILRKAIEDRKKFLIQMLKKNGISKEIEAELSNRPLTELEEEYKSWLFKQSFTGNQ